MILLDLDVEVQVVESPLKIWWLFLLDLVFESLNR
jgi:hypothetical protein